MRRIVVALLVVAIAALLLWWVTPVAAKASNVAPCDTELYQRKLGITHDTCPSHWGEDPGSGGDD